MFTQEARRQNRSPGTNPLPQFKRGAMIVVDAEMFVENVFTLERCLREFAGQLPEHEQPER